MDLDAEQISDLVTAMPVGLLKPAPDGSMEARANAISRFASDEVTTVMVGGPAGLRTEFSGVDGFVRAWADWLSPFERYESEVLEITEAGEDKLFIRTRQIATPVGTDVPIESEAAGVVEFRGDRITRMEFHLDPATARRAAGLDAG
jgi:ketosteroid isomerase-like protein